MRGQGTIEYLVIIAIVIVISLIVTIVITSIGGDASTTIVSSGHKIGGVTSAISVSEAVLDGEGKGSFKLTNFSGDAVVITRVVVDGADNNNYDSSVIVNSNELFYSFSSSSGSCACEIPGEKKSCSFLVYARNSAGITKTFSMTTIVDCVDDAQASISVPVVNANFCGEDSVVGTELTACGNIEASGNYTLTANLSAEGDCLRVLADDVNILGNNCTVVGNINASGVNERDNGFSAFVLSDINVVGNIVSNGGDGGSGGDINLLNSYALELSASGIGLSYDCTPSCGGDTPGGNGGNVYLLNSQVSSISASGGPALGDGDHAYGGAGGTVILVNSIVSGNISAVASSGYLNMSGGRLEISGASSAVSGTSSVEDYAVGEMGDYTPGMILFYSPCPSFDNIGVLSCGDDGSCDEECS